MVSLSFAVPLPSACRLLAVCLSSACRLRAVCLPCVSLVYTCLPCVGCQLVAVCWLSAYHKFVELFLLFYTNKIQVQSTYRALILSLSLIDIDLVGVS